ncbi:hypothetical protein F5883DRAFT_243097 [Diaporthe sp. PMI_573]|nr:hypothetical protein F5883DRAFT_243097 [Diaporthaceae sp. PMI_573]
MALPPKFAAQRRIFNAQVSQPSCETATVARHTIEVYLDYTCPYARRSFETLVGAVIPGVCADPALASNVQLIFRQQVQPWHAASAPAHEAALAVLRSAPDRFWDFSAALFRAQEDFFDGRVASESPSQTYSRLARVGGNVDGIDCDTVLRLLEVPADENGDGPAYHAGNAVTRDLKDLIRMSRLVGVHVTPTVVFDGAVQGQISSEWTGDQWMHWLRTVCSDS